MKHTIRKSDERGHSDFGWLQAKSTFSFARYFDPNWIQFRSLRVMQEDRIAPNSGFDWHPHEDMEIITFVLSGKLKHQDGMGHTSVIEHGHVQRMSAGTGVVHSEYNATDDTECHLHQIWILPESKGIEPSYEEKFFAAEERLNQLRLVVSPDGDDGSITVHQDASIYMSTLQSGVEVTHQTSTERHTWVQVPGGSVEVNGVVLQAGDGIAVSEVDSVAIRALDDSELLLFDLG